MRQPNIVLILCDDLGWRDLACYGSSFYETPNLDRFATTSMLFTDAYASAPVCSPTRASILSGKYPATVGVTHYLGSSKNERGKVVGAPFIEHWPLTETSMAQALREGGYTTWHIGKWHLGRAPYYPERHGFDVNIGGCNWGRPVNGYFSPWGIENLADGPEGEFLTDRLTDEAIGLIRQQPTEKPFFLNFWHYAVHTPIQGKAADVAKYTQKATNLGLDQVQALQEGEYHPSEHKKGQRITRRVIQSDPVYAALIENLDTNIGRLLQALDETRQADNTIVIFTSDNGGLSSAGGSPTCNAPLAEGKGWMYEGGLRVPLIVRWPGVVEPGSVCNTPVSSPDFYPSFLEAAGLPLRPEQHVDGVSILPILRGDTSFDRGPIYWHFPHYANNGGTPGSSVRLGAYKLIEFFEDNHLALYNLWEDPEEKHNLATIEPQRAQEMRALLASWRAKISAKIPEPNPNYCPTTQMTSL